MSSDFFSFTPEQMNSRGFKILSVHLCNILGSRTTTKDQLLLSRAFIVVSCLADPSFWGKNVCYEDTSLLYSVFHVNLFFPLQNFFPRSTWMHKVFLIHSIFPLQLRLPCHSCINKLELKLVGNI